MSKTLMYVCAALYLFASLSSESPRMSVILMCYAIANTVMADLA